MSWSTQMMCLRGVLMVLKSDPDFKFVWLQCVPRMMVVLPIVQLVVVELEFVHLVAGPDPTAGLFCTAWCCFSTRVQIDHPLPALSPMESPPTPPAPTANAAPTTALLPPACSARHP